MMWVEVGKRGTRSGDGQCVYSCCVSFFFFFFLFFF